MSKTFVKSTQPNNSKLSVQVQDDLTVQLFTNPKFDFLMDTECVAKGYGVSTNAIRSHKSRYSQEFKKGVHFIDASAVANCNSDPEIPYNKLFWTKQGIIRLGFFIKSERAKAFRDWAENVILEISAPPANLPLPPKRRHNRLTKDRLVGILADVARIDDKEIRLSLIKKLGV